MKTDGKTLAAWPEQKLLRALAELANAVSDDVPGSEGSRRAAQRFVDRWPGFLPSADDALILSYFLRQVWQRVRTPGWDLVLVGLLFSPTPGELLKEIETFRVFGETEAFDINRLKRTVGLDDMIEHLTVDWARGRLGYKPQTPLQVALNLLIEKSHLTKICANPDCPASFFVAKRSITKYCSDDCMAP